MKGLSKTSWVYAFLCGLIVLGAVVVSGLLPTANRSQSYTGNSPLLEKITLLLILGVFFSITLSHFIKLRKKLKKIHHLEQHGVLIKDAPYKMVPSDRVVGGVSIQKVAIDCTLPSGEKTTLYGDWELNEGANGKVDLLIDPNNPNNYYVDLNVSVANTPKID
jgi:hypothetical protein